MIFIGILCSSKILKFPSALYKGRWWANTTRILAVEGAKPPRGREKQTKQSLKENKVTVKNNSILEGMFKLTQNC